MTRIYIAWFIESFSKESLSVQWQPVTCQNLNLPLSQLMILAVISLYPTKAFTRQKTSLWPDCDCTCCLSLSIYSDVPRAWKCEACDLCLMGRCMLGNRRKLFRERVRAHKTSSSCVFLSSMSACVRVLPKELDAWLWVIEDVLKDSPAGEAGNREA